MALIRCTECGKEFSDKSTNCPNCACPTEVVVQEANRMYANAVKGEMQENNSVNSQPKIKKGGKGQTVIIAIVSIFIAVIFLIRLISPTTCKVNYCDNKKVFAYPYCADHICPVGYCRKEGSTVWGKCKEHKMEELEEKYRK